MPSVACGLDVPNSLGTSVFSSTKWVWLRWRFQLQHTTIVYFLAMIPSCNGSRDLSLMDYIEDLNQQLGGVNAREEDREIPHHISGFRVNRWYWKSLWTHSTWWPSPPNTCQVPTCILHPYLPSLRDGQCSVLPWDSLHFSSESSKLSGATRVFHVGSFYPTLRLSTGLKLLQLACHILGVLSLLDFTLNLFPSLHAQFTT